MIEEIGTNTSGDKFVRMDTVGENKGLIKQYENCGFHF
jgi:hypothetical protein